MGGRVLRMGEHKQPGDAQRPRCVFVLTSGGRENQGIFCADPWLNARWRGNCPQDVPSASWGCPMEKPSCTHTDHAMANAKAYSVQNLDWMLDEGETVLRTCSVHPEDAQQRSLVVLPGYVMAKTNKCSVQNLIGWVVDTVVTRGPNLNLSKFILIQSLVSFINNTELKMGQAGLRTGPLPGGVLPETSHSGSLKTGLIVLSTWLFSLLLSLVTDINIRIASLTSPSQSSVGAHQGYPIQWGQTPIHRSGSQWHYHQS